MTPAPAAAQDDEKVNYWLMDVPVMDGATNIKRERQDTYFSSSLTYEIKLGEIKSIHDFYMNYFKGQGWKRFFDDSSVAEDDFNGLMGHIFRVEGGWFSFGPTVSQNGSPVVFYSDAWFSPNKVFWAQVKLTLNAYDGQDFAGEMHVQITPEPQTLGVLWDTLTAIEIFREPRNFFIFIRAFPGKFEDLTWLDFEKVPEEYRKEKVVVELKKKVEEAKAKYKEFGDRYVDRSKIPAQ